MSTPAMGGFGRGRIVQPPQIQFIPAPSDTLFQRFLASQTAQREIQREDRIVIDALGSLQGTDARTLTTPFGRAIPLSARGQPLPDTSALGSAQLGGLQQFGMMTPVDRPIMHMLTQPALAPHVAGSTITYNPNTRVYTYYGADAAQIFATTGS